MATYRYTAYNLSIASELPLPELRPAVTDSADIHIHYGTVPTMLDDQARQVGAWEAAPGKFLLDVADVARYFVVEGREIRIEPAARSEETDIRVFLLGSAFGALLQQRHLLTLHASAVQTERGAVLFLGRSGSGKSTLATAFLQRGYALLADDITAITQDDDGTYVALPALPRTRLWADAAAKLNDDQCDRRRVRTGLEKYLRPAEQFCAGPLPVYAIYLLTSHNQAQIQCEPVATPQRFEWLYHYTYRKRFMRGLGVAREHFATATALAKQVKMSHIRRPVYPFLLNELADRIEAEWQNETDHPTPNLLSSHTNFATLPPCHLAT